MPQMSSAPLAIKRGLAPNALLTRGFEKMAVVHQATMVAAIMAIDELTQRGSNQARQRNG